MLKCHKFVAFWKATAQLATRVIHLMPVRCGMANVVILLTYAGHDILSRDCRTI